MSSVAQDRVAYLVVRSVAVGSQLGALVCLMPINEQRSYPERITGFVALCLIAWFLNLCNRHTGEYQRRVQARNLPYYKRQEFGLSILVTAFALTSFAYLQLMPTWTMMTISLSLGGCAGYALTRG